MKVTRVRIENYRNLRHVDVKLDRLVTLVGDNNSGKSNFPRAIALPLSSDDGARKSLTWFDINDDAKADYYQYIGEQKEAILDGSLSVDELNERVPYVAVTVNLEGTDFEQYDLKDLLVTNGSGEIEACISYRWHVKVPAELLSVLRSLLHSGSDIQDAKMSLLPTSLFTSEVIVPDGGKVTYDVLSRFRYASLPAERDEFASRPNKLGSRALIGILRGKLDPKASMEIERGYGQFIETIRDAAKLDEILNWQDFTDVPNAKDFFDEIEVLPNMPPMNSIVGGIKLGYGDESLAYQGLGYRNLILMAVMLNAYFDYDQDFSLKVISVEEPEAHLCVNNVLLMGSLFNAFGKRDGRTQLIYSTHDAELVNKVGLNSVIVLHGGSAINLKETIGAEGLDYLANNPNTDIFKLLFSRRLILVEGITEELLIKAYLQTRKELSDIKVMAFHKGYRAIIGIWKAINTGNSNRLGIVRDFDNQPNAQKEHEREQDEQVIVRTTKGYTLETDIVETGVNHQLLVQRYGSRFGWEGMSDEEIQADWRDNKKTEVMLAIAHDLVDGNLEGFKMPRHIQEVLDFLRESPRTQPGERAPFDGN